MKSIHLQNLIPEQYAGQRLDLALAKLFPEYSRSQLQQWIIAGKVVIDSHIISSPKIKVKMGQAVVIETELLEKSTSSPQNIPLDIAYEDTQLLIVNKPAGLVVHPGAGNPDQTLVNALLHYAPELSSLPRAGLIHRIDKDTSGLLLIAKNMLAYNHLVKNMQDRLIKREYEAVVEGIIISGGQINAAIGRHPNFRTRMAVTHSGKKAITHYRVLQKFRYHTLLRVELETGRTHQIRVHLAHIKHPIVGDQTYGNKNQPSKKLSSELQEFLTHFKRQALHARRLSVPHPITNEWIHCEASLPEDFVQLKCLLEKDYKINEGN